MFIHSKAKKNIWAATSENRSSEFRTRSDINRAVQPQKMARDLTEISDLESKGSGENRGAISFGHREADLRLCFRICENPFFSRRGSIGHAVHLSNFIVKMSS